MSLFAAIAENIEIIHIVLFALGIICLVIEFFEPGIGIFGAAGIILMVIDIFVLAENIAQGLLLFAGLAIIVLLFVLTLLLLASQGILPKKLVLSDKTDAESGYVAFSRIELNVGDTGRTVTRLRPAGKADFSGKIYDVVSDGEFIEDDTEIAVDSIVGNKITVKKYIDIERK